MARYLQIQIVQPCHENWNNMKETGQGRFCGSCQKNVIDFTAMSDDDLVTFFKNNTGNVCGRLTEQQLQADHRITGKRIPWLRYFFQIAIPAFLFSAKTSAQGSVKIIEKHVVDKKKVTSQFPISTRGFNCYSSIIPRNLSTSSKPALEELTGWVGAISVVRVKKVTRGKLLPALIKKSSVEFSIFPNPAMALSNLNIKWKQNITTTQSIEIFDQSGNLVQQEMLPVILITSRQAIRLKQLAAGLYVIKITDSRTQAVFSQQFIIQ